MFQMPSHLLVLVIAPSNSGAVYSLTPAQFFLGGFPKFPPKNPTFFSSRGAEAGVLAKGSLKKLQF